MTLSIGMRKLLGLIALGGALAIGVLAQENSKKQVESPKAGPTSTELPVDSTPAAPVDPNSFKVGPEDVLMIRVWREDQMTGQFVVRPDGKITLPLGGEIEVGGLTLEQIKVKVVEVFKNYVNKPEVSVSLTRVASKKYYLVGEFMRTGTFPLVVPTTVLVAINSAGGFQEFANKKKVIIIRGEQRIKFNYEEVIKGKNLSQNIFVESGDHIVAK